MHFFSVGCFAGQKDVRREGRSIVEGISSSIRLPTKKSVSLLAEQK